MLEICDLKKNLPIWERDGDPVGPKTKGTNGFPEWRVGATPNEVKAQGFMRRVHFISKKRSCYLSDGADEYGAFGSDVLSNQVLPGTAKMNLVKI